MAGSEEIFQEAMSMGHSAAWDQQWDKAAAAYQKALGEMPLHSKALSSLGLALYELGQFDESLEAYQKAAQLEPVDPLPLEKVGQLSERIGHRQEAIHFYLKAAELYIKNQEAEKALSNWMQVTQLEPENVSAHSYLAMVHERLDHKQQAATEYLTVASLLQRSGNPEKAAEMIGRALRLLPNSHEARQAQNMLKAGQLLPKPMQPQGGTAALRMPPVKQIESPKNADSGLNPIEEARKHAMTRLAEILFDVSDDAGSMPTPRRGMQAIVRGSGKVNEKQSDLTKVMLYISQAIDAQTRGQEAQAAEELEKALEAGCTDPALSFDLGLMRSKAGKLESAIRSLQYAIKHPDYALGARLLRAQMLLKLNRTAEAVTEYLEALKIGDASVVPPDQADQIRQLYEPLIEAQAHQTAEDLGGQLCKNIEQLLMRPNWRTGLLQAREQLPKPSEGNLPVPLAEILTQAQSSQVIDSIGKVRALARAGHLRTAMDEAFESIKFAPTYLPLHTLIGDLLIEEGRTQEAITKYTVVAEAYSARGEGAQAVSLLRRVVQVAPMDMNTRTRLIDQLVARGMVDDAVGEYVDLADIYYRLAELDMARKTYTTALRLAQQGGANRAWSIKLMRRMADIDMQRLDWRQAVRIFEQLRTLEPEDPATRKSLIELYIRLNQTPQAMAELDGFITHLRSSKHDADAIHFLEELVKEDPQQGILRRALAEEYRLAGRKQDAVAQLVSLADNLAQAGDRQSAMQVVEAIIAMTPPNVERYQTLLAKMRAQS